MANVTTTTSGQFNLNVKDLLKGLVMTVIGSVLVVIYDTVESGSISFDWQSVKKIAIISGVGYLLKNFFSPAMIKVEATKETVKAVKEGDATVSINH